MGERSPYIQVIPIRNVSDSHPVHAQPKAGPSHDSGTVRRCYINSTLQ
jgi:hypothetical protein